MTFKKMLLGALLGIVCLSVAGYFIWHKPTFDEEAVDTLGKTDFELGQYYFNHDDDPAGPYDLSLARKYFKQALDKDPYADPLAWYQLGRVEFLEGNFSEALNDFTQQITYFSDSIPNVYYMIGLTYGYKARQSGEESDWRGAEQAFTTFIAYAPQAPWSRVDLAWVYFAQGKYESMLPVLEQGIKFRPDNAWLRNMYGLALLHTDQKDRAKEEFTKARDLASSLTPDEWGKAYPGNDPEIWGRGLSEFQEIIEKNIALTSE